MHLIVNHHLTPKRRLVYIIVHSIIMNIDPVEAVGRTTLWEVDIFNWLPGFAAPGVHIDVQFSAPRCSLVIPENAFAQRIHDVQVQIVIIVPNQARLHLSCLRFVLFEPGRQIGAEQRSRLIGRRGSLGEVLAVCNQKYRANLDSCPDCQSNLTLHLLTASVKQSAASDYIKPYSSFLEALNSV